MSQEKVAAQKNVNMKDSVTKKRGRKERDIKILNAGRRIAYT
jgi:hypothetical protein